MAPEGVRAEALETPGEGMNIPSRRRWAPRGWRRPGALTSWKGTRGPVWTVAAPPRIRSARPRGCAWGGRRPRGPASSPGAPPPSSPLSPLVPDDHQLPEHVLRVRWPHAGRLRASCLGPSARLLPGLREPAAGYRAPRAQLGRGAGRLRGPLRRLAGLRQLRDLRLRSVRLLLAGKGRGCLANLPATLASTALSAKLTFPKLEARGTCPDVDGGGESPAIGSPESPRKRWAGKSGRPPSGEAVFVWVAFSIHACALATSPPGDRPPAPPFSPASAPAPPGQLCEPIRIRSGFGGRGASGIGCGRGKDWNSIWCRSCAQVELV